MPRRPHKKSRNGCAACKARHVKCDESRPECVNCMTAGSRCSFKNDHPVKTTPGPYSNHLHTSTSTGSTPASEPITTTWTSPFPPTSGSDLNIDHLELLHHFCTVTCSTLSDDPDTLNVWRNIVPRRALSSPFLMYEVLAIAALHIGHLQPSHRDHYYGKATQLQNSAMTGFHAIEMKVDQSNAVAVLLFSSMLALQVMADPTPCAGLTSIGYIDHFTRCFQLMQGTRVLVTQKWWDFISTQEDLLPLWKGISSIDSGHHKLLPVVEDLSHLTQNASLSHEASSAYDKAIKSLQSSFRLSEIPDRTHTAVRFLLAWPMMVEAQYLSLLNERRPEALIILAYYGSLMHFYRGSWIVGDTGARLIKSVSEVVGLYWNEWLNWPNEIINSQ